VPDVVIHSIRGMAFDVAEARTVSLLLPATTLVALSVDRRGRRLFVGWRRGVAMIVGIWLLGPLFMMIDATFGGGGFAAASMSGWPVLLIPGVAFIMAAYDGALVALLLATVLLPVFTSEQLGRGFRRAVAKGPRSAV